MSSTCPLYVLMCLPIHALLRVTHRVSKLYLPLYTSPWNLFSVFHFVKTSFLYPSDSVTETRPSPWTETTHPNMDTRCSYAILAFQLGPSVQCLNPKKYQGWWDKNLMVRGLSQIGLQVRPHLPHLELTQNIAHSHSSP